jgi:hypothetical protein
MKRLGVKNSIPTDRYSFELQECDARSESELFFRGKKFGEVVSIDLIACTVEIKKTQATAELHPTAVYVWEFPYKVDQQANALFRVAESVAARGIDGPGPFRAARDLLMRKPPRLSKKETLDQRATETAEAAASRIVLALDDSTFAIQGPPGSGKTFTGARMICDLIKRGKKVGVTAQSHKVIRKLLDSIIEADPTAKCMHLEKDGEPSFGVSIAKTNKEALQALDSAKANVLGATSFFWSREESREIVDVLFVDEAGQMSLADTVAVSQSSTGLVLLGDPQQLDRPMKGCHPDGAEKSALGHLLGDKKTISKELGFFLPKSWRLHPKICDFTSEVFYESKLSSQPIALSRFLTGHPWLTTAGLWLLPVAHETNRNSSPEEVDVIERIVASLLQPQVKWFYSAGNEAPLKREEDILIVAPYNAQVADLSAKLPGIKIGTVDKFQGQQAAVVIYSLTTSSPEDAPRGMEFLYSLNRFNVATSRAKCNVIVVASPKLLQPSCRTPRQMQLANALCRYAEQATIHHL